ncbi:MAG TPA: alpha-amylase family glycosyl hydrolase [Myxococcales bacterium]|nr:alpha-amylase family glycosyl hydrolase [Myxococcales bacterium]
MADMNVRNTAAPATPTATPRPTSTPAPDSKATGKAPAATPAPAQTPAPAAARSTETPGVPSSFDTRAARAPNGNGGIVPQAILQQGTPEAPVKRPVTFIYDAGPHHVDNLQLKGSWDANGKFDPSWQGGKSIPMQNLGDGKWAATVELSDDGQAHDFQWGVAADGPTGKGQWALMGEDNRHFQLGPNTKEQSYAPTTYHVMGVHRVGQEGASFKFWAPGAQEVNVKVTDKDGNVERLPMQKGSDGVWSAADPKGWSRMEGKAFVYELVDSAGQKVEKTDPYSRILQGEQRGLGRMYIDPASKKEAQPFTPNRMELMRFEIQDQPKASEAYLVLKDAAGNPMSKEALLDRLGTVDPSLVSGARNGKFNDLWSENILPDGRIKMTSVDGAFSTVVPNPEKLAGLRYEMQAFSKDPATGKLSLVGDTNTDGKLSTAEAKASNYNDPWSDLITKESGMDPRGGIVAESTRFDFKSDAVPREKDHSKWVVYQLHMGSFLGSGQDVHRSTFEDVMKKMDYFKSLGVNTLEVLPVNEFEGNRDWGYMGVNSMAVESAYGFEDENGKWVTGDEAVKRFVDMAHSKGLNVINDVVYNHVGGNYNDMWNMDGPDNPYFNWSKEPGKMERRDTPWGPLPAYEDPKVKQFFVDHAVAQVEDYHFDGLRFDFTEPIKGAGGKEGWDFLREVNRQVHFYKPELYTVAEQFDYDPAITTPAEPNGKGGAGFDAQWYTEYQHRLVHDNDNPGIIQAAANGQHTNMDAFLNMMTNPRGITGWRDALQIISNHDEVGNAERTISAAQGNGAKAELPPQWSRDATRFAAGIGLTGPGTPMFFQGDESMASNPFKWGTPNTWDNGWDWQKLPQKYDFNALTFNDSQKARYERLFQVPADQRAGNAEYKALPPADRTVFDDLAKMSPEDRQKTMVDITRQQTFKFFQDALALRNSSPAFAAGSEVKRIYSHNDNSVMAYERKNGLEDYVVVGSLNKNAFNGYGLELPPGQWKEVFNSDAGAYGGNNVGNFGATINGGQTQLNIPAGGMIVLKKVG